MNFRNLSIMAGCVLLMAVPQAGAGTVQDGFRWLSENDEVLREGIIWNDAIGDGKDRYKSGGLTHGWLIPERRIGGAPWIADHASAFELQVRGYIATPENTNAPAPGDRPFGEYAGVGGHLRTIARPESIGTALTRSAETRVGIELGLVGDPLPFFELQDLIHGGDVNTTPMNTLDGEFLANVEGRRTWRFHQQLRTTDVEVAPFVQVSAGMRENSVRVGGDIIYGSSLEGRLWNHDLATGALIPGGSSPRHGPNILVWVGGDAGYIANDALLDGGFNQDGPRVNREEFTGRFRAGIMLEHQPFAIAYSMTLLSEEFDSQEHSQVIGAITVKYNF